MVVAVLLGSVRSERIGARVAKWVVRELEKRGHEAVLVDPAELRLPLLDKMWKELKGGAPREYEELRRKLEVLDSLYRRTDGVMVVSAEYNHSVPPALTNLLDYFLEEYFWKPSAIVCYSASSFGGVRAAMQLRALLPEIGMPTIPSLQPIPSAGTALSEDGVALTQQLAEGTGRFFTEFEWYMRAFKAERAQGVPY